MSNFRFLLRYDPASWMTVISIWEPLDSVRPSSTLADKAQDCYSIQSPLRHRFAQRFSASAQLWWGFWHQGEHKREGESSVVAAMCIWIGGDGGNWVVQSMSSQVQKPLSKTIASWFASRFQGLSWGKWVSNNLTTFSLPLALSALKKKKKIAITTILQDILSLNLLEHSFIPDLYVSSCNCFPTPTCSSNGKAFLYFDFWI